MTQQRVIVLLLFTTVAVYLMVTASGTSDSNPTEAFTAWRPIGGGTDRPRAVDQDGVETFAQCVHRPKSRRIYSVEADMRISEKVPVYELPLFAFRKLVARAALRREGFIRDLNRLPEVIGSGKGGTFRVVYVIGDDMLIHRGDAFYGFHVRFGGVSGVPKVRGVVNHYDIVSQYSNTKA